MPPNMPGSPGTIEFMPQMLQFGAMGLVMVWLMFQVMPRLKAVEAALDRFSRAMLLTMVNSESKPLAHIANSLLAEINEAEKERQK